MSLSKNTYRLLALCGLTSTLIGCISVGSDEISTEPTRVGIKEFVTQDPMSGRTMNNAVYYPSDTAVKTTRVGPYTSLAETNAQPNVGKHPLIVLSHGSGGSRMEEHDYAEALARNGYVVLALDHPGDNYQKRDGVKKDTVLIGRPVQASHALDTLLKDTQWQPLVDSNKIGMMGFSMGGYTSLVVAGARPSSAAAIDYCMRNGVKEVACEGESPDLSKFGQYPQVSDPRVKAIFIMAPVGMIFDRQGLQAVTVPTYMYIADADQILKPSDNGERIKPYLPNLKGYQVVQGAGHTVFTAPCPARLKRFAPPLCNDPVGVDRVAVHEKIKQDALGFFNQSLSVK